MQASDLFIIVLGIAMGYHGGTLLNWAFFTYIAKGDDDDDDTAAA